MMLNHDDITAIRFNNASPPPPPPDVHVWIMVKGGRWFSLDFENMMIK